MDKEDNVIPIVIDNGSAMVKAGFAGDKVPRAVFPNVVGTVRVPGVFVGVAKNWYIGKEAQRMRGILRMKYPVEDGIVTNWDDMEKILHQILFTELRVIPNEHPVLLTESPLTPNANWEKMAQVLFEAFDTPSLYLTSGQALSLYSQGCTTGVGVDSGSVASHILPVYKGLVQKHCVTRVDVGGRDLTSYMLKLLSERGYSFCCAGDLEIANDIKEKLAYVTMDVEKELSLPEGIKKYLLPDGQEIKVGHECFRLPEPIFNPYLIGLEQEGLHRAINESITKSDVDVRKYLYNNIVLAGGNTMFSGISERLHRELSHLAPNVSTKVRAPPERIYSAWLGGSVLASMDSFENMTVLKSEYSEHGPAIIHRKCI